MKQCEICDMKVENGKTNKRFSLRCNGIPLEVSCTLHEFNESFEKTMKTVNDCFINSIRFIKLYGVMPPAPRTGEEQKAYKKAMDKKLNVWSQTDTGVAVRGGKMPIKEFQGFFTGRS